MDYLLVDGKQVLECLVITKPDESERSLPGVSVSLSRPGFGDCYRLFVCMWISHAGLVAMCCWLALW